MAASLPDSTLSFGRPRPMPVDGVSPRQVDKFIKELRQFIGPQRLDDLVRAYRAVERSATGVEIYRLRDKQPLIEGFEAYRRATLGYRGTLSKIRPDLHQLANIAANYWVVAPTLTKATADHQREKLVDFNGQLAPLMLEWMTAATASRVPGCEIAWFPVHASGPEFVVRGGGMEWEMECKRQSPMVVELLGENEAANFAGRVLEYLHKENWQGELEMIVPAEHPNRVVADDIVAALRGIDFSVPVNITLDSGLQVRAKLRRKTGRAISTQAWQEATSLGKREDCRLYGMGRAQGEAVIDPLIMQLAGPQRTGEQIVEQLWTTKFRKAASQCTGQRAAALVFEWEGIGEPSVFRSPAMTELMARTYIEFPHVTFIGMRCVHPPSDNGNGVDFGVRAYSTVSKVSPFAAVGEFLDSVLGSRT